MASVGLKISNPGFDANKAAGYQLLFNSSWPTISITYESTQTIQYTAGSLAAVTFTHGLGYPPFAQVWISVNGVNIDDFSFNGSTETDSNQVEAFYTTIGTYDVTGGPSYDLFGNILDGSLNAVVSIKCYNIDLSKDASYPFYQSPTYKQPYSKDIGIKVVKENKNIDSPDLRDFILHSRGQSPTVLSVQTEDQGVPSTTVPGDTDITFINPQGYVAWVFGFVTVVKGAGLVYLNLALGATASIDTPGLAINQGVFTLTIHPRALNPEIPPGGTLLVLRDPLFASNTVNVTY